jgi:hypothetical protein
LTTLLESQLGWRNACFVWAVLHLAVALPLNALIPAPSNDAPVVPDRSSALTPADSNIGAEGRRATLLLAYVFAVTWFVSTAMASHLPRLLEAAGLTLSAAVWLSALVGPAQVGGRLLEFGILRHISPLLSARCAALAHPLGAVLLMVLGGPCAMLFVILHGAGNGILTIAKGTLPLMLFGPVGYGARQGWLTMPARIAQASAPFAFGMALDSYGAAAAWWSAALGFSALAALLALSPLRPERAAVTGIGR